MFNNYFKIPQEVYETYIRAFDKDFKNYYLKQYDELNIQIAKSITINRQTDIEYGIYYKAPLIRMIYDRDINKCKFITVR